MFIGHTAAALLGRRIEPSPSLGTYVLAATFADLLLPIFLLLGWEQVEIVPGETVVSPLRLSHYPYSHSLLAAVGWSVVFGLVYWLFRRRRRGALTLGLVVLSHWVLDFISHEPDMQIVPWSPTVVGLSLWNSLVGTALVEGALFAVGVVLYLRATRPKDRIGRYALAGLVGLLAVSYAASLTGGAPPNIRVFAIFSITGGWLTVAWAYVIDRHRTARN